MRTVVIQEALDKLGSTPDEIAASLEAKGIKGSELGGSAFVPMQDCPISLYLHQQFPEVHDFFVSPGQITWYVSPSRKVGQRKDGQIVISGTPLSKFITDFDLGEYPELVR